MKTDVATEEGILHIRNDRSGTDDQTLDADKTIHI
jgi:hypothetical protein